jgi:YesN/AraC family two-component response regulator
MAIVKPISLLIVEDDKETLAIITRMVAKKFPDYTVYGAENGVAGIEIFKQFNPDLVITDANMPVMDGVEMVRSIRRLGADKTFIVVTAYSDKVIFDTFRGLGVCAYLLKPLDFNELFASIEICITKSQER